MHALAVLSNSQLSKLRKRNVGVWEKVIVPPVMTSLLRLIRFINTLTESSKELLKQPIS
ncbi:6248_t:CDS:2 [Ambispora leptoticha]|uniref:6248_t:CDS:1 n=1 Tax=Ambispora leptoticha TaxID=144679 RepID=A0A9N8V5N0_9GLOM|nr:6248_t:CDS:2 [Ambispora leptoticha]